MVVYIGDIPVSSIQNISLTNDEETIEIDNIDSESNVVLSGEDLGREIEIEFTLISEQHPENAVIEDQRTETKELISNDSIDNSFEYEDYSGFISTTDVSLPETSSSPTVVTGTIEGIYMPWPKYFGDERPGSNKRASAEVDYNLSTTGEASGNKFTFISADVELRKDIEGILKNVYSLDSIIELSLDVSTEGDLIRNISSDLEYSVDVDCMPDLKHSSVVYTSFSLDVEESYSLIHSAFSDFDFTLDSTGEAEVPSGRLGGSRLSETRLGQ